MAAVDREQLKTWVLDNWDALESIGNRSPEMTFKRFLENPESLEFAIVGVTSYNRRNAAKVDDGQRTKSTKSLDADGANKLVARIHALYQQTDTSPGLTPEQIKAVLDLELDNPDDALTLDSIETVLGLRKKPFQVLAAAFKPMPQSNGHNKAADADLAATAAE